MLYMKKHIIVYIICFFIVCTFLLFGKNSEKHNNNCLEDKSYKNNNFLGNVSIIDAIKKFEKIKYFEEEREVIEDTARYIVVFKTNRFKRPRLIKYKNVFIKPKFRVQSARSIIGDEGFANI